MMQPALQLTSSKYKRKFGEFLEGCHFDLSYTAAYFHFIRLKEEWLPTIPVFYTFTFLYLAGHSLTLQPFDHEPPLTPLSFKLEFYFPFNVNHKTQIKSNRISNSPIRLHVAVLGYIQDQPYFDRQY
jgi:hypothetical protein